MKRLLLLTTFLLTGIAGAFAQLPTQTVRGQVIDNQSKTPLPGATIVLIDSLKKGAATDPDGRFRLADVPIGRRTIRISLLGYKEQTLTLVVSSGKEVVLTVELEEKVIEGGEVVIEATQDKSRTINEMTSVSARTFTIEETQRYAGALGDPSRMAANYAGVQGANDSRNDIIIRGNSPLGVLWRLNGLDIPSPNHFGSFGSTGGPVSILNNNVLDNSDFLTGAFPAEYGNALAGVFDLRMRNGNNEKHEFMGQVGFNGFELGAEGPLSKNHNASYLLNYRYSSLDLFTKMGVDFGTGTAVPHYQDISFKMNMPTKNAGTFSIYGIGGLSHVDLKDSESDTTKKDFYSIGGFDTYYKTSMGVTGLVHAISFGNNAYNKFSIAVSEASTITTQDSVTFSQPMAFTHYYGNLFRTVKVSFNEDFTKKFNSKNTLKVGARAEQIIFTLEDSVLTDGTYFRDLRNVNGQTWLVQAYTQWQHKFSDVLTLNAGAHVQDLTLNNSFAAEPRLGLRWEFKPNQSLSIGSGLHSQMQTIFMYFNQTHLPDGTYLQTNHDLDFMRSVHGVVAYDRSFTKNARIKIEAYYQYMYDVPIMEGAGQGAFSLLNDGADFFNHTYDSLVNKGTGRNYGVEITAEKFYSKGWYGLLTTSLFESKYTGNDGIERNTTFNGNYVINLLAGKEFQLGPKNVLSINLRTTFAGGRCYTPIDLTASGVVHEAVYLEDQAYSKQYDPFFKLDIKPSFTRNGKHITQQWAIDITNVTNHKNVFLQAYDAETNSMKTQYQMGLFVVPMYRINF